MEKREMIRRMEIMQTLWLRKGISWVVELGLRMVMSMKW